jgi:hypothetical protein
VVTPRPFAAKPKSMTAEIRVTIMAGTNDHRYAGP